MVIVSDNARAVQPFYGPNLTISNANIGALLYTGGWGAAGLQWHHNWLHDASEKCLRGDDQSENMTVHHNVIFNCGKAPVTDARSETAGYGVVLKGNGHVAYANTVYAAEAEEWCLSNCVEKLKAFRPQYQPRQMQNTRSHFFNSIGANMSGACECNKTTPPGGKFEGWYHGSDLDLRDPEHFDFRPTPQSRLVKGGVVV